MKSKKLIASIMIVVSVLLIAFTFNLSKKPEMNTLNYFNPSSVVHGELKYELNFENAVTKLASHIIVGTPESIHDLNEAYDMIDVKVQECLMGDLKNDRISVRARKSALNMDGNYILFINTYDSPLFKNELYTLVSEYVMKVDKGDSVLLVENPVEKKYIKPFKEEKYNNVASIKASINEIKHKNIHKNKEAVVNKPSDINQLISISDHIFEITVTNVENIQSMNDNTMLSSVSYKIDKNYKGEGMEEQHRLLLPDNIMVGKKYLLFYKNKDESIVLATREGSIVEVGSQEYDKVVKALNK